MLSRDDWGTGRRNGLKDSLKDGETRSAIFTDAPAVGTLSRETTEESFLSTLLVIEAEDAENVLTSKPAKIKIAPTRRDKPAEGIWTIRVVLSK
jgi:hypothetical protein